MVPLATIVIPTRDRAHFAARAIRSALRQTVSSIEIIVVDDGSHEEYGSPTADPRVLVIRKRTSSGPCAARNVGLEAARGEWITFLDDDDELLPDMVERSVQAAKDSALPRPVAILSGRADVDQSGRAFVTHLPVTLPRGSHYLFEDRANGDLRAENTLFVPVELLKEIGGWDEAIRSWEHDDLLLRLNGVCSLEGVPAVTYLWHEHTGQQRHEDALDSADGMKKTLQKHGGLFHAYPRRYAHYLGTMGVTYLKAGKWGRAVAATTHSVLRDPRRLRLWLWWLASITGPGGLALYRAGRRWKQAVRSAYREPE